MNITRATYDPLAGLRVVVDGFEFLVGDKRSILDLGFVSLVGTSTSDASKAWLTANTGGLPAGPDWGALRGPGLIQNQILVELALRAWEGELVEGENPIPPEEEAAAALKRREVPTMQLVNGRFEPWI